MAVKAIPDEYQSAIPYLSIKDASRAIDFYKKAFGAEEVGRMDTPDGKVMHAELKVGNARFMLSDTFPEWGMDSPESLGGSPVTIMIYVKDVDALVNQAVAAGVKVNRPVQDEFYGDRAASLVDPFGHKWSFATHKEDLSPEEMNQRAAAMFGQS